MKNRSKFAQILGEYTVLTLATLIMAAGIYLFRFPNHFSFGGVTGFAVVLSALFPISASGVTTVMNVGLLVLGLVILGRGFGIKTIYVTVLLSGMLSLAERLFPMTAPLTDEPLLELIFAIVIPAIASAVFFNMDASSGGTDIIAMILTKYTRLNITTTLMLADVLVAISAFFIFDTETGLYSVCGLLAKSLVIDGVIENINLCKVFTIICDDPEPISDFILTRLKRGVTTYK
ncbi:MAG: YitT family protein, partial [Clostridia bacterium]|nr:YitT family protein [Clostridia bacterium]